MGIKIDVIAKPSFRSQLLVKATEFRHEVVPVRPEVFGRSIYLQEFLRNRRGWSPLNGDSADLTGVDAWLLKDVWDHPYVRRISKREFPEVSVKDFTDLKFDARFPFLSCQLWQDFRFHHGMEVEKNADLSFRDCAGATGNKAARFDCYLPPSR